MVGMKILSDAERSQVIACICEGNSIRVTVRLTGIAQNTITKLPVEHDLPLTCPQPDLCYTLWRLTRR